MQQLLGRIFRTVSRTDCSSIDEQSGKEVGASEFVRNRKMIHLQSFQLLTRPTVGAVGLSLFP